MEAEVIRPVLFAMTTISELLGVQHCG